MRRLEVERQLQAHHDRLRAGTQRAWLARYREKQQMIAKMFDKQPNRKERRRELALRRQHGRKVQKTCLMQSKYAKASLSLMHKLYAQGIECVVGFQDQQEGPLDVQVKLKEELKLIPKEWEGIPVAATLASHPLHQFQTEDPHVPGESRLQEDGHQPEGSEHDRRGEAPPEGLPGPTGQEHDQ